jgi:hypothetical protein
VLVVVLHANRDNRRARRAADEIEAASWTSSIVTAPMQRAGSDATSASASASAGSSEEETVQLGGVGKDVPGRLPVPATSQPDRSTTSTDGGAVTTATGPDATTGTSSDSSARPSPRPGRKPGRR